MNGKQYDLSKRVRCVNAAWHNGRRVRILHPAFGYAGKIGEIMNVGSEKVYVRIKLGKKPGEHDEVAYLPAHLRLI
jgi:ribosomal protein L21E